jgi:hypothetical protein
MLRLPADSGDHTPGYRRESTMTWVIIGVVLLVAFGPVLWLVPSRRDRRLAALRARGRAEGLVVELGRLPKRNPAPYERVSAGGKVKNPVIECATYSHPLRHKMQFLPVWRLVRIAASESSAEPDPFPGWSFDQRPDGPEGRRYLGDILPSAEALVNQLPDDVVAVELASRFVRVFWLENPGSNEASVTEIAAILRAFEADMMALEAQIEAQLNDTDS